MNIKNIARRRGTSIAAAALSVALVAPFAQPVVNPAAVPAAVAGTPDQAGQPNDAGNGVKYPGKNADGVYQSVVDEQRYTFTPGPPMEGAIESGAPQGTNESIEGYIIHQRDGDFNVHPGTPDPWQPIPMEGVRVYAQWTEKGGVTSPVYTAVTRADGRYTINMKPFNNAKGEVVKFDADPNGPQYEKIRVWADNPDPENFTQLYGYRFGGLGPEEATYDTIHTMGWLVGPDRVTNVRFAFGEKIRHDVMHRDDAAQNPVVGNGPGQIRGHLFWHLWYSQGAFTPNLLNKFDGADVPATGMKVYGSYLSDYAVNQIKEKAANDLGFKEIRGSGWTNRNEVALQNWIKRKMAEEGKDKWIAETAEATVGSDGFYNLQFKGTFGRRVTIGAEVDRGYDDGALIYTDLARDNGAEVIFPDKSKHNAYSLFGQVAPTADYGSWEKNRTGRGGDNLPKHVNWDWLFFSTEETEGFGQFTPFYNNSFLPRDQYTFNGEGKWAGGFVLGAGEPYLLENRHIVYSDYTVFDVLEYDTHKNPAKPGDKADTKTGGLPITWAEGLQYQIEWVDGNTGKVVKTCAPESPKAPGTIESCQLDTGDKEIFPDGIKSTTTFTAYLYPVNKETGARGSAIAADAFTVLVGWQPLYEKTEAKEIGKPAKSKAPTFDNTATTDTEKLTADELTKQDPKKKPTKFELAEGFTAPEGYTVEVDAATGEVSVTFPKDAPTKASLDVPVKVTYEDKTVATATAPFVLTAKRDADKVEPKYEDTLVDPNKENTSTPTFFEQDEHGEPTDKKVEIPPNSKFSIPDDFKAPDGYTVNIDKNTGVITVTVDKDKLNKDTVEDFDVPVNVEYPDGSGDKTKANFKLDTDGDGTPDVEDPDDDGDGTPDTEEIEKDTNPKVPNQNGQFEPKYEDKTVLPGGKAESTPDFYEQGKDGKPTDKKVEIPEKSKFSIPGDFKAPEGYTATVDPNTGVVTVTTDKDKITDQTPKTIEVPVVVKYPDNSEDNTTAKFNLGKHPEWEDGKTTPNAPVTIPKTDGSGDVPEGATVEVEGGDDNGTAKINEDGSITVTPGENAKPGDKITVIVKDKDGNEIDRIVVEIVDGPQWEDTKTTPDAPVTIPKTDDSGEVPEGATVEVEGGDDNGTAKINEDGSITVTPGENAKPGDKITVIVKDKDGNELDKVVVEIVDVPQWEDGKTTPDAPVTIPKTDGSGEVPEGATVEVEGPGTAKINDDGSITVTPGENAKPGDKITVTVKDKDGNELDKVVVEIVDPWKDKETYPKESVTVPKEDGFTVPEDSTVEVEGPGTAELLPNGDIKVTPNDDAEVGNEIKVTVKDKDGNKVDDFTVKIVEKPISSSQRKGCTESLLGFGLPLLALIPLGIAAQAAIPGLQAFQAQLDQQVRDMNTALQRQLGILDPNLARAAAEFDARLKGAGANLGQVLAGLAALAYGIAAIATIATKCGPSNKDLVEGDNGLSSSIGKIGEGSSGKQEGENGSSIKPGENGSSDKKEGEDDKGGSSKEGSSKPSEEAPAPEQPGTGSEDQSGDQDASSEEGNN
ncbi:YPDG domain-containing protein [Corynebacterium meitnerae]|uniref:YPDG domain-containing protein n=1 Tax=Corynebacterium meitnerae TaxID=2913498 RepID=A0A9X3LUQ6_9CORY|nr:YPDG domain-containing protein [Corynebacterium meitnerae]MCZ9294582.1 YPDG domain-containing protein [Corynebacterium meitnerae]